MRLILLLGSFGLLLHACGEKAPDSTAQSSPESTTQKAEGNDEKDTVSEESEPPGLKAAMAKKARDLNKEPLLEKGDLKIDPETLEPYSGRIYELYDDGKTIKGEGLYLNGKWHGLMTRYRRNGNPELAVHFKNGVYHGVGTRYRSDGTKDVVSHLRHGKLHGPIVSYRRNGTKKTVSHFVDDKEHGLKVSYNEDGKRSKECRYENGIKRECKTFNSSDADSPTWRSDVRVEPSHCIAGSPLKKDVLRVVSASLSDGKLTVKVSHAMNKTKHEYSACFEKNATSTAVTRGTSFALSQGSRFLGVYSLDADAIVDRLRDPNQANQTMDELGNLAVTHMLERHASGSLPTEKELNHAVNSLADSGIAATHYARTATNARMLVKLYDKVGGFRGRRGSNMKFLTQSSKMLGLNLNFSKLRNTSDRDYMAGRGRPTNAITTTLATMLRSYGAQVYTQRSGRAATERDAQHEVNVIMDSLQSSEDMGKTAIRRMATFAPPSVLSSGLHVQIGHESNGDNSGTERTVTLTIPLTKAKSLLQDVRGPVPLKVEGWGKSLSFVP